MGTAPEHDSTCGNQTHAQTHTCDVSRLPMTLHLALAIGGVFYATNVPQHAAGARAEAWDVRWK